MVSNVVVSMDEPLTYLLVPDSPVSDSPLAPPPASTLPAVNGKLLSGGTSTDDDIVIVSCGNCGARNVVETSKDSYYLVLKGRGGIGVHRSIVSSFLIVIFFCSLILLGNHQPLLSGGA